MFFSTCCQTKCFDLHAGSGYKEGERWQQLGSVVYMASFGLAMTRSGRPTVNGQFKSVMPSRAIINQKHSLTGSILKSVSTPLQGLKRENEK